MRKIMLAATAIAGFAALSTNAQAGDMMLGTESFASGLASGAALAPGDITVRLSSLIQTEISYATDSYAKTANGKNSGIFQGTYMRLYPHFDAKAANGLLYGGTFEIRMNSGTGFANNTGGSNTLYVKRGNIYVGTPVVGTLYAGPENNAMSRSIAGTTMESFDYNGGFNGDFPSGQNPNSAIGWTSARGSGLYSTNKLVYVSPNFSGFTVGFGYEPNQNSGEASLASGGTLNPNSSSLAGVTTAGTYAVNPKTGLITLGTASTSSGLIGVRRNTVDVGVRYAGSFGPLAVVAGGGYLTGGRLVSTYAGDTQFKNPTIYAFGTRLTYGPFAIGGTVNGGTTTSGNSMIRKGQKSAINVITGAQYIIGPVIFGVQYVVDTNAGSYNSLSPRSQLREYGVTVGGSYDFAPGATLYGNVFYDQRHQYGYNFATGAANTTALGTNNNIQARGVQIGTAFKW